MQAERRNRRHHTTIPDELFTSFQTDRPDTKVTSVSRHKTTLITEVSEPSVPTLLHKQLRSKSLLHKDIPEAFRKDSPRLPNDSNKPPQSGAFLCRLPSLPPSRLGPGSYNTQQITRVTHSIYFEKAPRFPMSYREKLANYRPSARELSPEERKELAQRIQENIQAVKRYTPVERLKAVKQHAALELSRSHLTRTLHQELKFARKQRLISELEAKQRRFEWRMRPTEISLGKHIWCGLFTALSLIHKWDCKYISRKKLHKRSQKILKFLLLMTISVGKICMIVRKKRRKTAFATLKLIVPFLIRWKTKHKAKLREQIATTLENCTAQVAIYQLIATWKRRIVSIQRRIKQWLMQRKLYKQLIVRQWEKAEMRRETVKNHKLAGYVIKEIKAEGTVPEGVKYLLVEELLREKVRVFVIRRKEWQSTCSDILLDHQLKQAEEPLVRLPGPQYPPPPQFSVAVSEIEIQDLQQSAEKKRSRWDRMTKDGKQKKSRVHLSV